jgi:hypothetical protein
VTRALWSVGLICDSGLNAIFKATHAVVQDKGGREVCYFERKHGLYVTTVKLLNPLYQESNQGFQRQGA